MHNKPMPQRCFHAPSFSLYMWLSFNIQRIFILTFVLIACNSTNSFAQKSLNRGTFNSEDSVVYNQYLNYINKDKITNKYPQNRYFLPPIFDGKFGFDISYPLPENPYEKKELIFLELKNDWINSNKIIKPDFKEKAYRRFLQKHPDLIKYTSENFEKEVEKVETIKPNFFQNLFSREPDYKVDKSEIDKSTQYVPKRRYWKSNGSSSLQFSQSHISDNWASGGTGSFSLLSYQKHITEYEKNKIKFKNTLEWRLRFYQNKGDSVFQVGDDLFRNYSEFAVQAFLKKWYYSLNMEVKTQLFTHTSGNTKVYQSAFFAPFQVNVGGGMKYELKRTSKTNKHKTLNFNVDISPFSAQSKWLFNDDISPKRHGIDEGKQHKIDLGSTLNSKLTVNFNREISFSSRFKYFTSYKKVLVESESELTIAINRYFSTSFYIYGKFDDDEKITKDPKLGYFQYNQLFSFKINFNW